MRSYSLYRKLYGVSLKLGAMSSNLVRILIENPSCLTNSNKYVLLLSHMRSRSTVLAHILGSNKDICGYRELHHSYRYPIDFIKLKSDLYHDFKTEISGKRLLDKLLHNNNKVAHSILNAKNTQIIFLLREPESSIRSIMKMGIRNDIPGYDDPEYVTNYYCNRLEELARCAKALDHQYFFVDSDELINDSENILKNLSDWLNIDTVLNTHYDTFNKTGTIVAGDPSENIKSGKLIRTKGHADIEIPLEYLEKARQSYQKHKAFIAY